MKKYDVHFVNNRLSWPVTLVITAVWGFGDKEVAEAARKMMEYPDSWDCTLVKDHCDD
jgi:hypothetical protein